jgi:branched-chain amino acid transport system substrate-binding protein
MSIPKRRTTARYAISLAAVTAVALAATACASSSSVGSSGGSSGGSAASGSAPIKVAQITTISGGYPFGAVVPGTQAYFNMINAQGGIDGHKIQFVYGDDKGTASQAAELARLYVLQDHVVAMVGNTSLADCNTNASFYAAQSIAVIGGGTEPLCFSQPNWDPVNSGPYYGKVVQWQYTFNVLKPTTVCEIEQNDPTSIPYYNQLRTWFESQNPGVAAKFKEITYTNDATQNPTPAVAHAKALGCDLIELSTVAPNMVAFIKAAKAVGLDATFITLGSGYDTSVPGTLGALGDPGALGPNDKGVFVGAELAAVNSTNPQVQLMAKTFKADNVPANFWSEIGWVSAATFVAALKEGASHYNITTASGVLQALQHMSPYDSGFAANDLTFGPGNSHPGNRGGQILLIQNGTWVVAPDQNDGSYDVVNGLLPAASS